MNKGFFVGSMIVAVTAIIGFSLYQLGSGSRLAMALQQKHDTDVVLYSAQWCSACDATRHYLTSQGHEFVERDLDKQPDAASEFAQFGGHGIPLVLAKGEVLRGHRPSDLRRILASSSAP